MNLVGLGYYPTTANCRTKSCDISRDIWHFYGILHCFGVCSMLSRGTSNDVLRNPGWDTLVSLWMNYVQHRYKWSRTYVKSPGTSSQWCSTLINFVSQSECLCAKLGFSLQSTPTIGVLKKEFRPHRKKNYRKDRKKLHNEQPSLFDFFIRYYFSHHIKEDRVGAASSTHRRQTKRIHFEFENREGKEHLRDQSTEKTRQWYTS